MHRRREAPTAAPLDAERDEPVDPAIAEAPQVPGYRPLRVLGVGGSGAVWAAQRMRTGEHVAIKVLRAGERVEVELALLRGIDHPHVVRLIDAVPLDEGAVALALELVGGGSLARLVGARGHLTPGEAVTVISTLARTLADLHARGVIHGDVAPGNVLFQADGRPLLADLGVARLVGAPVSMAAGTAGYLDPALLAGALPGVESDVYGLGALAWLCLVGSAPGPAALRPPLLEACPSVPPQLAEVVESALSPEPARRPPADRVARAVYEAVPAQPLLLAAGADPMGEVTHRIRRLAAVDAAQRRPTRARARLGRPGRSARRTAASVGGLVAVAAVLVLARPAVAAHLPRHHDRAGPVPAGAAPAAQRALDAGLDEALDAMSAGAIAQELAAARARAFATSERADLAAVDVPGSAAWAADDGARQRLAASGLRYRGLRISVTRAVLVSRRATPIGAGQALLRVTSSPSAYDVVSTGGELVRHMPAAGASTVVLQLVRTSAGWRVATMI